MTKTTNYEISKKLAEIGFNKETNFYFTEIAPDKFEAQYYTNNKEYLLLKSYDLETLLDALPREIPHKNHKKLFGMLVNLTINFIPKKDIVNIGYSFGSFDFIETKKNNESLADTAGRMIIELYNNNLIKF
jgi:hypothetical protein